jgi:hypothetical protein
MTKDKFVKAIRYLHGAYPSTFKLDIEDNYAVDVWYDLLKSFDDEQFVDTLRDYAKHNTFAPNSAAALIEWEKDRIMRNLNSGEKFETLISRIRAQEYNLNKVMELYKKGEAHVMVKTIKELYSDFTLWFSDSSQLGFLKSKFLKTYVIYAEMDVRENMSSNQFKIGNDDKLKLE